jgi:hypothetical protein
MTEWDVEIRPRLTPRFAYGAAALVLAVHVAVGALLKVGSTGVIFRTADQVAIALLGVVFAVLILVLSQPRLRIGPRGIAVRNAFTYKLIPWSDVVDVSFPVGARWARVAIQAVDKQHAVAAMDTVREHLARYQGGQTRPGAE